MTQPRRIVPGTTYHLSRRTVLRTYYFVPSAEMNAIYEYALAAVQQKHGLGIHGFACMSNHPHEVVTDVRGVLPLALADLHREIANAVKALRGIPENVFACTKPSAVELATHEAVLDAIVYTVLNPVEAGLVAKATQWPGAISLPGARSITVKRPSFWFAETRPETLTIELTPPPSWEHSEDAWHVWLAEQVAEGERVIQRERHMKRRGFLGAERVLAESFQGRPNKADDLRPSRHPTLATSSRAAMMVAVTRQREWRCAYREARDRWLVDKNAVFPTGAWWVVQCAGAATA